MNTQNFTAYAVNKENQPLIDALNSGLDAVIADGTWSKLDQGMVPGPRKNPGHAGPRAPRPSHVPKSPSPWMHSISRKDLL